MIWTKEGNQQMRIANFDVEIGSIGNAEVFILHVMKDDSYYKDFDIGTDMADAGQFGCVLDLAEFVLYTMGRDCSDFSPMFISEEYDNAVRYYFFNEVFPPQIYPALINGIKKFLKYNDNVWNKFDKSLDEYPEFFENCCEEDYEEEINNDLPSVGETNTYRLENLSQLYKIPHCKGRVFSSKIGDMYLETNYPMEDFLEKITLPKTLEKDIFLDNTEKLYEEERD